MHQVGNERKTMYNALQGQTLVINLEEKSNSRNQVPILEVYNLKCVKFELRNIKYILKNLMKRGQNALGLLDEEGNI